MEEEVRKELSKLGTAQLIVAIVLLAALIILLLVVRGHAEPANTIRLDIYASEVAAFNTAITAGSDNFYLATAVGINPLIRSNRWIIGIGGGVRLCCFSADIIHYKINEGVWTYDLNELYTLRCIYAWDAGRVSVIGGLTLNRFVSTLSDGTDYRTFSIREGRHGAVMTNWWPGFIAGIRF